MPRITFDKRYKKFKKINTDYPACLSEVFIKEVKHLDEVFINEATEYEDGTGHRELPWGGKVLVLLFHQNGAWFPDIREFNLEKAKYYFSQRRQWFKIIINKE